mmetsp:Transcript_116636/g.326279  ORF Transcript_116636/g.326279 Transcript_116636/m.326279 type:complete len:236 (+) Transcript_116636:97-804(+)|eukprot:CAMPEP_0176288042 /NCGR_PEP_ID=MMETSP0121_2-20121125/53760_1 /TAXON_ID=160619 /ORGANISM="Kryptoperidinium foliaceum, Strain CCMP 1326" /LENGTH=235 /DNA_ID=CAMNT_0017628703 /DNA_START=69 /DNA_END=776 /DNA_ORIENTATION=-
MTIDSCTTAAHIHEDYEAALLTVRETLRLDNARLRMALMAVKVAEMAAQLPKRCLARKVDDDFMPHCQPWRRLLPPHLCADACSAAVAVGQRIARWGLDKRRAHRGFMIIIGDEVGLAAAGTSSFNPFQGHDLSVVDDSGDLDEETFDILRRNAFNTEGAVVLSGKTGKVLASGWCMHDDGESGRMSNGRSLAAAKLANKAGGCCVIFCHKDSSGELTLHLPGHAHTIAEEGFKV